MPRSIFITGFPGFIAGELVKRFLSEPATRVSMLVMPAMQQAAEAARAALPPGRERTEIVIGDITQPYLGLDEPLRARLEAEIDVVYHLAAIYDLATPHYVARLVNVTGTEHVLDFCAALPRLARLIYFSTAYVSGTRRGRVLEDDLEQASAWKNYYELTKWEAETAVRRRWGQIPTIVIRPGVAVGDSRTGATNKYDGPYYVVRAMADLERRGHARWARYFWAGGDDTRFHMVPVDFICDATEELARQPNTTGRAYHVLPNPAPTMRELTKLLFAAFGLRPPPFSTPPWIGRLLLRMFPALARALQMPPELFAYLRQEVEYDTRNLDAALAGTPLRCPTARELVPVMVDFVRKHPDVPTTFGAHSARSMMRHVRSELDHS